MNKKYKTPKNFPKKLKIGGHVFSVTTKKMPLGVSGSTDIDECTIEIEQESSATQKWSTLLHEIFHAMNTEWDTTQMGHIALESLAQQIFQVLSDNNLIK